MAVIQRVKKPTTRKGKKVLQSKEPKPIEGPKQSLFLQGRNPSERTRKLLKDIYDLKKPDAAYLNRKNDFVPFEDASLIEKLCYKKEAALFGVGTHSKKRPHNIILGRTFDYGILDMIELGADNYKAMSEFHNMKVLAGIKPCLIFNGPAWDLNQDLKRLKSLFTDFFNRDKVETIRLQGLEHVLSFTATETGTIYFRSYRIQLKKSGQRTPRIELEEIVLENETKNVEAQKVDDDPLTRAIGALGKWQIWICFVVFLVKFPVAWHQMSIIFLAPPMNFTCASNVDVFDNVCHANCTDYKYDHAIFKETIVSQWDLVCDKQWLKNLTQTIFMLGILVGNMMFGHLSDRYGRRNPFLAAVFLQLISGVTTAYSVNWYMFTTLRFLLAVATGGTMVTSFVLTMELIGAKYRDTVGIIYQIPFNLGHLTLSLFGYYLRDWSTFQLAISLPSVLFLSYYFLLPESPRWLLTTGKAEEAIKIMEAAAKVNGRPTENIASTTQKIVVDVSSKHEEHVSFLALFRTPRLRARTIAICFNWFVCGLCFFGVSQYIGHVSGNIFTNVAISAAIQVPGTLISIYANRLLGRKITLISANCIAGLSCLLIIVVPHSGVSHLTLGCIGLWAMSISFATVYLYAGELFPTVVRNSGVGLSSTVARIGSMVAPFVATLAHTSAWLPPLAFGIVPLIGAGLCIILPDTRGRKLPDTLEEGEA